jgi:hypothetical protein
MPTNSTTTNQPTTCLLLPLLLLLLQELAVVGSAAPIGHWDPAQALRMTWTVGDVWWGDFHILPGWVGGSMMNDDGWQVEISRADMQHHHEGRFRNDRRMK